MLADQPSLMYARFAEAAIQVQTEDDFRCLVDRHVQPLMPHGMLLAVIGQLTFEHLTVQHHVAMGYEAWALAHLTPPLHMRERPVVVCTTTDTAQMSDRERFEAEVMQMGCLAVHGIPDISNRMGSYFSFARVTPELDVAELTRRLGIMVPLLHVALMEVNRRHASSQTLNAALTAIELELLDCLAAGRTNEEIAAVRQRSPATVRNQLNKLYGKLGVGTRAEAVALASRHAQYIPDPRSH